MGSSSGRYNWNFRDVREIENTAQDEARTAAYEATANSYLEDLLGEYNNRDTEGVHGHLDVLHRAIEKEIEGFVDMLFGGSVRKHTYVDGLSDIDTLLVVNTSSLANKSPQAVLSYIESRLRDRLPGTQVKAGDLAVTITYSDGIQIQILPAIKTARGIRISDHKGTGWSNVVGPHHFAKKLTQVNQSCGNKVVPVIKLFKGLQTQLPENCQLKGYHIESLAVDAFENYTGRKTYKDMLHHFLRHAGERVKSPLADTTGQSRHVDEYLGAARGSDRIRVSKSLERLARKIDMANGQTSIDRIRDLFDE